MNNALNQLQPYPFEKLRALLGSVQPNADKRPIALSIGEPKHRSPDFVAKALADNEEKIVAELKAVQGKETDIGGYYLPDPAKTEAVMRPSASLNAVLDSI